MWSRQRFAFRKFAQSKYSYSFKPRSSQAVNVSPRSVENASKVLREGTSELVQAVEQGQVAVSTAAIVAELPKQEQ